MRCTSVPQRDRFGRSFLRNFESLGRLKKRETSTERHSHSFYRFMENDMKTTGKFGEKKAKWKKEREWEIQTLNSLINNQCTRLLLMLQKIEFINYNVSMSISQITGIFQRDSPFHPQNRVSTQHDNLRHNTEWDVVSVWLLQDDNNCIDVRTYTVCSLPVPGHNMAAFYNFPLSFDTSSPLHRGQSGIYFHTYTFREVSSFCTLQSSTTMFYQNGPVFEDRCLLIPSTWPLQSRESMGSVVEQPLQELQWNCRSFGTCYKSLDSVSFDAMVVLHDDR